MSDSLSTNDQASDMYAPVASSSILSGASAGWQALGTGSDDGDQVEPLCRALERASEVEEAVRERGQRGVVGWRGCGRAEREEGGKGHGPAF